MANKLRLFEFKENEASFNIGKIFSDAIRGKVSGIKDLNENFYVMKRKLIDTYPKYYKEICDRAKGAGVDKDKYLLFVSYELYESNNEKCTDIIVKNSKGEILCGHNEDGPYTLNNSAIIKYITETGWYTEYSCIDSLAGTTYLWNSNGVIFSGNYVYTKRKELKEISTWFVLRDLVECRNIDQILDKIKSVRSASGFNLNVIDTKISRAYSVEFYIDKVSVKEITGKFDHTNHFIHLDGKEGYYPKNSNTKSRLDKVSELLNKYDTDKIMVGDVKEVLEYSSDNCMYTVHIDEGVYENKVTSASFMFDSKTKTMNIHDYLGNSEMMFRIE